MTEAEQILVNVARWLELVDKVVNKTSCTCGPMRMALGCNCGKADSVGAALSELDRQLRFVRVWNDNRKRS